MRIISGKHKGKSIDFRKNNITRPLKDSVRENIFNILVHSNEIRINLLKSNVLDLYSGIGSFGLECISRGAKKVTFVEENIDSLNILKKNLLMLAIEKYTNAPRQKFPEYYEPNGYVDIVKPDLISEKNLLIGNNCLGYITDKAIDVDDIEDFVFLEYIIKKNGISLPK